ncbi:MAG: hypothetical protein V4604_02460 [Bacteroidota bacterium]
MKAIIITLALLVSMGWSIVYFKYETGGIFHLTLIVAVLALMMQLRPQSKS